MISTASYPFTAVSQIKSARVSINAFSEYRLNESSSTIKIDFKGSGLSKLIIPFVF